MILEKVKETIRKFDMLKNNDRVIVAVSGGPDSVSLVYLLNKLKKKWGLYLHIAHLNHMLREDESDKDSLFVRRLAEKLNIPVSCESIDVKGFAQENKLSIEEAARNLRYDFLLRAAKQTFASKIALGHNQDDQAETVLMRFLRGSGISGLRGIPAKRTLGDCLIIRPLIEIKRREIMDFLSAKDISYRSDSSNLKSLYFRNRVRNELMPYLEKDFNPSIKEMLINLAENVSWDFDYLEKAAEERFKKTSSASEKKEVILKKDKFLTLHKALQKLLVRLAIKKLKGNVRRIDYRHWKELEDLLTARPQNSIVDLPGGISAVKKNGKIVFYHRNPK